MKLCSKRPSETIKVLLDFSKFVELVEGVAVTYTVHANTGITVAVDSSVVGQIELTISGGVLGCVYEFGVQAAAAGKTEVQMYRIGLRDPRRWYDVPAYGSPITVEGPEQDYVDPTYFAEGYVA